MLKAAVDEQILTQWGTPFRVDIHKVTGLKEDKGDEGKIQIN